MTGHALRSIIQVHCIQANEGCFSSSEVTVVLLVLNSCELELRPNHMTLWCQTGLTTALEVYVVMLCNSSKSNHMLLLSSVVMRVLLVCPQTCGWHEYIILYTMRLQAQQYCCQLDCWKYTSDHVAHVQLWLDTSRVSSLTPALVTC